MVMTMNRRRSALHRARLWTAGAVAAAALTAGGLGLHLATVATTTTAAGTTTTSSTSSSGFSPSGTLSAGGTASQSSTSGS